MSMYRGLLGPCELVCRRRRARGREERPVVELDSIQTSSSHETTRRPFLLTLPRRFTRSQLHTSSRERSTPFLPLKNESRKADSLVPSSRFLLGLTASLPPPPPLLQIHHPRYQPFIEILPKPPTARSPSFGSAVVSDRTLRRRLGEVGKRSPSSLRHDDSLRVRIEVDGEEFALHMVSFFQLCI